MQIPPIRIGTFKSSSSEVSRRTERRMTEEPDSGPSAFVTTSPELAAIFRPVREDHPVQLRSVHPGSSISHNAGTQFGYRGNQICLRAAAKRLTGQAERGERWSPESQAESQEAFHTPLRSGDLRVWSREEGKSSSPGGF